MYSSGALSTFVMLCDHHHCPTPQFIHHLTLKHCRHPVTPSHLEYDCAGVLKGDSGSGDHINMDNHSIPYDLLCVRLCVEESAHILSCDLITNSDSIIIMITIINITGKLRHRESNPFLFGCFCVLPPCGRRLLVNRVQACKR